MVTVVGDADATSAATSCDSTLGATIVTLRSAIEHFDAIGGTNVITFSSSLPNPATILLTVGADGSHNNRLVVTGKPTQDLSISGPGSGALIIDANGAARHDRAFDVSPGATLHLSGATVDHGNPNGSFGAGAIQNLGALDLANAVVSDNTSGDLAGGIDNSGIGSTVTISGSVISNNSSASGNVGGGLVSRTETGSMTVTDSLVTGNTAPGSGRGGGIFADDSLTLTRVTLSNNATDGEGGGLAIDGGIATLVNVTIAGNSAPVGGGLWARRGALGTNNITVSDNSAPTGAGVWVGNSGGQGATLTVHNSIIAKDTGGTECAILTPGQIGSQGHNLASDNTCNLTSTGDKVGQDPLLGPLQINAPGRIPTMAIQPPSPSVDAGDNVNCPAVDERGVTRPQGSACDIGAFEFIPVAAAAPGLPQAGAPPLAQRPSQDLVAAVLLALAAVLAFAAYVISPRLHRANS